MNSSISECANQTFCEVMADITVRAEGHLKLATSRPEPLADGVSEFDRLCYQGAKHASWLQSLQDGATKLKDKVTSPEAMDFLKRPEVMAGLGSAVLGGGLSAMSARRPGEGIAGKSLRVLGNAGLAGALGAGTVAAGRWGLDHFNHALPKDDVDPVTSLTHNWKTRGILGAVGGSLGLGSGRAANLEKQNNALGGLAPKIVGTADGKINVSKNLLVKGQEGKLRSALNAEDNVGFKNLGSKATMEKLQKATIDAASGTSLHTNQLEDMLKRLRAGGVNYGGGGASGRDVLDSVKKFPGSGVLDSLTGDAPKAFKRFPGRGVWDSLRAGRLDQAGTLTGAGLRDIVKNIGKPRLDQAGSLAGAGLRDIVKNIGSAGAGVANRAGVGALGALERMPMRNWALGGAGLAAGLAAPEIGSWISNQFSGPSGQ